MAAISENFADILTPIFRNVFDNTFNQIPSMLPDLYNMQQSEKSTEQDTAIGGFPDTPEFSGTISYSDVFQQFDVTYTPIEFAQGFKIERRLFDDDLYAVMNKKPQGLAISARRTREKRGASVFNDAFSTATFTGGDGLSLCNSAHTSNTSGVSTQSNTGTTALSQTSVETVRVAMAAFKDWEGELISVIPDLILVPRNLEQTAWEIIASRGKVETANNNANFHFGRYKLAVWDFMTDANNWFVMDTTLMGMFLLWFDRVALEFNQDRDFDTLIAKFSDYMRFSFGFSDWRWLMGENVS